MRLIDADALLKDIADYPYGYRGMINDTIAKQPTVDAVEVVRCKDCVYRYHDGKRGYMCDMDSLDPYEQTRGVDDGEWYCADGERREDGIA